MADDTYFDDATTPEEAALAAQSTGMQAIPTNPQPIPLPQPLPLPLLPRVSGLYVYTRRIIRPVPPPRPIPRPVPFDPPRPVPDPIPMPRPMPDPVPIGRGSAATGEAALTPLPIGFEREELRLDVDGQYPQMAASGVLQRGFSSRVHWIARLEADGANAWTGRIWYKDGDTAALPHTTVRITAVRSFFANQREATVTFSGSASPRTRTLSFSSFYFHKAEFEYDNEVGAAPMLDIDTGSHPNRPAGMPTGNLTIETVYRRSGFDAARNAAATAIPNDGPDPNATWSDAEMHDAMQTYWSRFANAPQWALWVLFAKRHDIGSSLGGIMFDDIGPNHRQGTAVFTDSFVATPPAGDPAPAAWVDRMMFWTAVHEMGHAFNLAHSWQKHLGTPWIPLSSEPEARSFMNYPFRVAGGQSAFFADFEFRFSDPELVFMRHAPERFVQQGNADWFDHHGFEGAAMDPEGSFHLQLRVDRSRPIFDFLEPIVLELRLTNLSGAPKIAPADLLEDAAHMTVVVKRDGRPTRQWLPFAHYCRKAETTVLMPGDSRTESLFVSAGRNGWDLAEPGLYTIQVAIEVEGYDVVSEPLRLRVTPPRGYDEELVAQDVFTDDAGRVMAFDGSRALEAGNDAWRSLVDRLPKSRAAVHARVALALPEGRDYRCLRIDAPAAATAIDGEAAKAAFEVVRKDAEGCRKALDKALVADADMAAETLGRADFEYYTAAYAGWLKDNGDKAAAKKVGDMARKAAARLAPSEHPIAAE